ncbi:MAG: 1-acyl-sn-glycerol-3-phosphate acyltransferase [Bacteroidota bacterium]|nr:1-acyl-sn-glycerol-3-phosphate acyltransferase [Bacteroidota bacterium]
MSKYISSFLLRLFGWDTSVRFPAGIKKCVIAVGPHTSGWDVVVGVLYRSAVGISNAKFLGKKELFDGPFGFVFKYLGGTPVDRFNKHNVVEQAIDLFNQNEISMLALSPEGTRKKVDRLRTGFYHIAKGANVPIIMAGLDFKNKRLILSEPVYPTNNEDRDLQKIIEFFAPIQGKIPEFGMRHLLLHQ